MPSEARSNKASLRGRSLTILALVCALSACATGDRKEPAIESSIDLSSKRRFESHDPPTLLEAARSVFLGNGYTIEEQSDPSRGVLVANRITTAANQASGEILMWFFFGLERAHMGPSGKRISVTVRATEPDRGSLVTAQIEDLVELRGDQAMFDPTSDTEAYRLFFADLEATLPVTTAKP